MLLRLGLVWFTFGVLGNQWPAYLTKSDGGSYLRLAEVIWRGAPHDSLTFYDSRVFPGWPFAYGWLLWLVSAPVAALGATILCAAAVPCVFYAAFRVLPTAAALIWLPPAWLLGTIHPIAEAFFLLMGLAALSCWLAGRLTLAGFFAALMCAAKPYGVFLAVPLGFAAARLAGSWSLGRLLRYGIPLALVAGAAATLNLWLYGEILHQLHVYSAPLQSLNLEKITAAEFQNASGHWAWPFRALVVTPWQIHVPAWKILYVYFHVAAALLLLGRPVARMLRTGRVTTLEWVMLGWLAANTAAICSGGPYWGFMSFDRYFVWAWPAALALNADLFISHPRWHVGAAAVSVALTLFAQINHA